MAASSSTSSSQSSSGSARSRQSAARVMAQTTADAKLQSAFERQGESFDYAQSVAAGGAPQRAEVSAYLQQIQRANLVQPFGCLLALDEATFRVVAYSENAPEMLTAASHAVPSVGGADQPALGLGADARAIFTAPGAAALQKAATFPEVALLNPILVHCKSSGKPLYAIAHRVRGCLVVDLEPVRPSELPSAAAGALQSYKLAAKAIARLQALPGGSLRRLCETVVQEVAELTGYDRVMAYRFHEDDHGEVVAEAARPGLEPFLGLHYPATDIPQASRFLFLKNRVRIICDCRARPVPVRQADRLPAPLSLCGSTLRAPHGCHAQYMENMGSIASLVMAVVLADGDDDGGDEPRSRLWGLVVCHHGSPRFVPFPLRYACEFLAQVFAIHVNKELVLERQAREKSVLRTQTLLCDLLLRDAPLGVVAAGSPNIMDLVHCDGAAMLHGGRVWRLGRAPSEAQIRELANWLAKHHAESTGLSTDSLLDAGYPGAMQLGDAVCGMAAARIAAGDLVFWFRSHAAAEIRWGGEKHNAPPPPLDDGPSAAADGDAGAEGRRLHPRSSFKAFLEVMKMRSAPWKDYEMDAVHSLQIILRGAVGGAGAKPRPAPEPSQDKMEELRAVTNEMVRLIETATVPILAVDSEGLVNGWNLKLARLTGLPVGQAIGKHLLTLVEDASADSVRKMLDLALRGEEEEKEVEFQLKTHGERREEGPVILVVNACASRDVHGAVVGVCLVAQDMTEQRLAMDRFTRIEGDYKAIVLNPSPLIPPIFAADEFGWCAEWNPAMARLSGWDRREVVDKMLLGEVFGARAALCRLKNQEAFVSLSIAVNDAMAGRETRKVPFGFLNRAGKHVNCLLSVSQKSDGHGAATGIFCFLQTASEELQQVMQAQRLSEQATAKSLRALSYLRREIRNPLAGIDFSREALARMPLSDDQRQILATAASCRHQLDKILADVDLDAIANACLDLEMAEFTLKEVLMVALSQVMSGSKARGVDISCDLAGGVLTEPLYGDRLRLQQIVADFLQVSVKFSRTGGRLEVSASLTKDTLGRGLQAVQMELRITHQGSGVPEGLLAQMFGDEEEGGDDDGISLLVCRNLLRQMNGDVRYLREAAGSSIILSAELASVPQTNQRAAAFAPHMRDHQ
ncbi:phytochrome A [Wolffia australiana]